MTLRPFSPCALTFFVLTLTLLAQPPTAPSFEVVSIHPVPPDAPPLMRTQAFTPILPGGQYIDSRTSLLFMIAFAYNVKVSLNLLGLPNWAQKQSFSITAKPPQDSTSEPTPRKKSKAGVNTNLEEISDWLTKIIVGVSLVEAQKIKAALGEAAMLFAKGLGGPDQVSFAYALMLYFSVSGFLGSYLLTRLYLQRALDDASTIV